MSLSRKDYQAIADAILATELRWGSKDGGDGEETEVDNALQELKERLADYFAKDNSRFDYSRFMWACVPSHLRKNPPIRL